MQCARCHDSAREDFLAFDEPGYAKAGLNFCVLPDGNGSHITTETRVIGTDAEATRKFRRSGS